MLHPQRMEASDTLSPVLEPIEETGDEPQGEDIRHLHFGAYEPAIAFRRGRLEEPSV